MPAPHPRQRGKWPSGDDLMSHYIHDGRRTGSADGKATRGAADKRDRLFEEVFTQTRVKAASTLLNDGTRGAWP
ncbi:MAG: hypothetical protein M3434_08850 [Gemmatimonadota bacterium]|nr:hypothetical protein [Gemmatimonadota bacterium]